MRTARRLGIIPPAQFLLRLIVMTMLAAPLAVSAARAETLALEQLLSAVVHIKTTINPDGRSVDALGRTREGSGIVIDDNGLILTIGYLMVEAEGAEVITNEGRAVGANVVGYDHESGFGLLRAIMPLNVRPLPLGHSSALAEQAPVVIAGFGGAERLAPAVVVSRRGFAGGWEYLLDEAIFTAPPYPAWSGAALIDHTGKLVGVGSLVVADASGHGDGPGNMFVPIDRLSPILADLIADGRAAGPGRPWLGVTTREVDGRLVVIAVAKDGPAEKAGVRHGDVIVGVGGAAPNDMADFYRKIYAQGAAGATIPLDVRRDDDDRHFEVKSINRLDHLRLKSTY
jgi:S1-C subfamily serine protease